MAMAMIWRSFSDDLKGRMPIWAVNSSGLNWRGNVSGGASGVTVVAVFDVTVVVPAEVSTNLTCMCNGFQVLLGRSTSCGGLVECSCC